MSSHRFGTLVLVLIWGACIAAGQTTGGIAGSITDAAGAPVEGAAVEATSPSLQGTRTATSGSDGLYRIPGAPPGEYVVRASYRGYRAVEKAATVRLGATANADFTLETAAAEEVVVEARAPLIDITSTTTGTNYTSRVIAQLPVQRNYADVIRANPGVSEDIKGYTDGRFVRLSIYGATSGENQWIIDGINTTEVRDGSQGKAINNEFVQEVEVMTGGYSAAYGRATGGIINAVTKSGGNEFHGGGFYYFDSLGTTAEQQFQPGDSGIGTMKTISGKQQDYGVDLGGYFLKDTLWFFGAYNRTSAQSDLVRNEATTHVPTDYQFPLDTASNYYTGKLTWNLASSTTVTGSVISDSSSRTGLSGADPVDTDPSTWYAAVNLGGTDYGVRVTRLLGVRMIANVQGSYHEDQSALDPPPLVRYVDNTCAGGTPESPCNPPPEPNDIRGGYGFVGGGLNSSSSRRQVSAGSNLAVENHDLRAGGDYMDGRTERLRFRTGGQQVFIHNENGQLYYEHRFYTLTPSDPTIVAAYDARSEVRNYGAYVEDSWRPTSNLTVNLGLRWDGENSHNPADTSELRFDGQWQPRIGVVWDPWRDGATKLYASAGRFSRGLTTFMALNVFGSTPYNVTTYNFEPVGVAQDPGVGHDAQVRGGSPLGYVLDDSLKAAYQDELTVGVERLLTPTFTVGLNGTYRSLNRTLEDRCDFDYNAPALNGSQCALINPGSSGMFASGNAPTVDILTGEHQATGPPSPAARRYYRGIELLARDSIGPQLWVQASYVYSSLRGNYNPPDGLAFDFDYPPLWHDAYGTLYMDRTNRFRLDGYWVSPWRLTLGLQAFAETGAPLSKYGWLDNHGPFIFLTPQGSEGRLPTLWGTNLSLSYPITIGPAVVTLQGYLYNVFNKQIAVSRDQSWTTSPPPGYPDNVYDPNQPGNNPNYGQVTGRSSPRLFRAACKVAF